MKLVRMNAESPCDLSNHCIRRQTLFHNAQLLKCPSTANVVLDLKESSPPSSRLPINLQIKGQTISPADAPLGGLHRMRTMLAWEVVFGDVIENPSFMYSFDNRPKSCSCLAVYVLHRQDCLRVNVASASRCKKRPRRRASPWSNFLLC